MTKRLTTIALLMVAMLVAALSVSDTVHADGPDYETMKDLIDRYQGGDNLKLDDNDNLEIPTDPKDGIEYRLESKEIDISTGEITTTVEGVARFYLPVTGAHKDLMVIGNNDLAIYTGTAYDIALNVSSGGFATYVIVRDKSAPTNYEFDFDLPKGFELIAVADGSVEIRNGDGERMGVVAAPWAVDANDKAVPTNFKVIGDTLVQVVKHEEGTAYPVVADPRFTFGWHIYAWLEVPDQVSKASRLASVLNAVFGIGVCTATGKAAGSAAAVVYCGAFYVFWGDGGALAIDKVTSSLPDPAPSGCHVVLAFTYIGLLNYAEHSGCGTDIREYAMENLSAKEILDLIFG